MAQSKKSSSSPLRIHFTATLERSQNKLWGCHFRVPSAIARKFIDSRSRRVICALNDSTEKQCALIPFGGGSFVITVNKSLQKQLNLKVGLTVRVQLSKDKSSYGLPMPEELREVLRQDKEGDRLFHDLTPGKLRTLLYIVGQANNIDGRIFRALTIVRHLKSNAGKINYKELSLMLRGPLK
ncbi:MAG: DUF1905 domain-containing protein [Ignavibacteriales bacterium]|nr:DUF1905 domain-containing protein [Ignavibacteriales bacterium]